MLKNKLSGLPWICGGLGLIGMGLRFWLLKTGIDEKGLLLSSHAAHWLILAVTAAAAAAVTAAVWGRSNAARSTGMFPASVPGGIASAVGCIGIFWSVWTLSAQPQNFLARVTWILGVAAALAAVFLSWCRFRGLRPHFLARTLVTLYLMFHLVYHYQLWFSETQHALYAAQLLSHILLILACYHRTALEANLGGRKAYILTSQLAGFFCLLAVPGAEHPLFYGSMAVWLLVDAGKLYLPPREAEESV